tara:strand:- start:120 stop:413 length:294 start_codon:yes stop_codon:yes gene_type:complete
MSKVTIISKHKGNIIAKGIIIKFDDILELPLDVYAKVSKLYPDHIRKIEVAQVAPVAPVAPVALDRESIIEQLEELQVKFDKRTGTEKLQALLNESK